MTFSRFVGRRAAMALALSALAAACSEPPTRSGSSNADIPADPETPPPELAPTTGVYVPSSITLEAPLSSNPKRVRLTLGGLAGALGYTPTNVVLVEDGKVRGFKLTSGASARLKADVVFAIDNTSSMAPGIASVRTSVLAFVTALRNSGQDVRVGVVAFNDNGANDGNTSFTVPVANTAAKAAVYGFRPLSPDLTTTGEVYSFIASLPAVAGGDQPELAFSGIDFARTTFDWRNGAQKIYIVISDVTSWGQGITNATKGIAAGYPWTDVTLGNQLRTDGAVVHCICPEGTTTLQAGEYHLRPLASTTGGTFTRYTGATFDLSALPILGVTTGSVLLEYLKNGSEIKPRTVRVIFEGGSATTRGERSITVTY